MKNRNISTNYKGYNITGSKSSGYLVGSDTNEPIICHTLKECKAVIDKALNDRAAEKPPMKGEAKTNRYELRRIGTDRCAIYDNVRKKYIRDEYGIILTVTANQLDK